MDFISILSIFVMACFVGYYVVWSVTPALHTPLMAVTNAISSVIVVGALLAVGAFTVTLGPGSPTIYTLVTLPSLDAFGAIGDKLAADADYRQKAAPFAEVLCRRLTDASLSIDNQTERVSAEMVSGNFFTMLGVRPALGRVFNSREDDQQMMGHPVAVLVPAPGRAREGRTLHLGRRLEPVNLE